jgi:uncharacterized membrane protein HdeD (DUF308 family)
MIRMRSSLVWRGILALVIGIIAIAWPEITVGAFVILFAFYAFLAGILEGVRAFRSEAAGPAIGRYLLAALDIAAGVVALAWPGITALVLVIWVAIWALVTGVMEIVLAFGHSRAAGERALLGLTGVLSIAFAVVLFVRPDIGAITLAQLYGFFSLVTGVSLLALAVNLRTAEGVTRPAAT